jgi:hypothetical protein
MASWFTRRSTEDDSVEVLAKPTTYSLITSVARKKGNAGLLIETAGQADVSYEDVQEFEFGKWHDVPGKNWDEFVANRPYSIKGYVSQAPLVGGPAPDAPVHALADGTPTSLLATVAELATKSNGDRVAVIFGSMTCPVWRGWAAADLHRACAAAGLPILHVYIKEAHAAAEFQHPVNESGLLKLAEQVTPHASLAERQRAASRAKRHLEAQLSAGRWWSAKEEITMVVDSMTDELESSYEARPFRVYVLDATTRVVLHKCSLAPFNLDAKMRCLREFLGVTGA